MKVCITAKGPSLDSDFEEHFARAPYFVFYNTRTRAIDAVRNGFVLSTNRLGQNAVKLLKMNGLEVVITGTIGDNAKALLKSEKISIHLVAAEGTVRDALSAAGMADDA